MNTSPEVVAPRSSFVTSVAWTFIVLAGFATAITLLQNIMISVMFPVEEIRASMREAQKSPPMPAFASFMLDHIRLMFGLFFAVCALTLMSAIGLLKRKNWARLIFISMMVLGMLWNLAGVFIPYFMFSSFPPISETAPRDLHDNFQLMTNIMMGFTTVIVIIFALLFGWIAKRLMSPDIKGEFNAL